MCVAELCKNTRIYLSPIIFHLDVVNKIKKIKLIKYKIKKY